MHVSRDSVKVSMCVAPLLQDDDVACIGKEVTSSPVRSKTM